MLVEQADCPKALQSNISVLGMDLWQPLQSSQREIRVLSLEPSNNPSSRIVCNLKSVSLNDNPKYEALSYVWGDASDRRVITLGQKEYSVTVNLFDALTNLRSPDTPRTLWVDAVCINQPDLDERASQVAMMGSIYSEAIRTVVWLDKEGDLLENVHKVAREDFVHFQATPFYILHLVGRLGWWHRAWTLQEAIMGRDLVFYAATTKQGVTIQELETFTNAISKHLFQREACCKKIVTDGPFGLSEVLRAYNVITDLLKRRASVLEGRKFDLLDLMFTYNSRLSTDLRDRIFAYIGLAQKVPQGLVNYQQSLPECFIQSNKGILEGLNGLEVLSYVEQTVPRDMMSGRRATEQSSIRGTQSPRERMKTLPSWCPDWTQEIWSNRLDHLADYHKIRKGFSAGLERGECDYQVTVQSDNSLQTTGTICDVVGEVGPYEELSIRFAADVWSQWCTLVRKSQCYWSHVTCDACNQLIWGIRHKCNVCENFDFCSMCLKSQKKCHPNHDFNVMTPSCRPMVEPKTEENSDSNGTDVHKAIIEKNSDGSYSIKNDLWDQLSNAEYPFAKEESVQDAFRKTLMMDQSPCLVTRSGVFHSGTASEVEALFDAMAFIEFWSREIEDRPIILAKARAGFTKDQCAAALEQVGPELLNTISNVIMVTADRKRLFVTRDGYVGLGPFGMKPGDLVCVLHGAQVPHILREFPVNGTPSDHTSLDCTLVGDAYAHGLMKGEALELEQGVHLQKRNIVIH